MAAPSAPRGPLAGIRILDLTSVILGPYATMLLGDMGAEVIKVESPGEGGGDIMRWPGSWPEQAGPGMGPLFMMYNKNKKSVALDLKRPRTRRPASRWPGPATSSAPTCGWTRPPA